MEPIKETISFSDFSKLDLRVGEVISVEHIDGSDKLLKLLVDFGFEKRQILSGIKKWYTPETIVGKQFVFALNLEPKQMMGLESQGMLIAAHGEESSAVLYILDKKVENGSKVS